FFQVYWLCLFLRLGYSRFRLPKDGNLMTAPVLCTFAPSRSECLTVRLSRSITPTLRARTGGPGAAARIRLRGNRLKSYQRLGRSGTRTRKRIRRPGRRVLGGRWGREWGARKVCGFMASLPRLPRSPPFQTAETSRRFVKESQRRVRQAAPFCARNDLS